MLSIQLRSDEEVEGPVSLHTIRLLVASFQKNQAIHFSLWPSKYKTKVITSKIGYKRFQKNVNDSRNIYSGQRCI